MKINKIVIVAICLAMLFLPFICEAETAKWNEWIGHNQTYVVVSDQIREVSKWYLDGNLAEINATPTLESEFPYTFNSSQRGYHNITYEGINANGTATFRFFVYVGTMFIVPNITEAVNVTSLSVLTAPGERFNLTTLIEPWVVVEPKEWRMKLPLSNFSS